MEDGGAEDLTPGRPTAVTTAARQGLCEPLPAGAEPLLRRIVLEHAASERRRRHTPLLHVGRPGAETVHAIRRDDPTDHALRADVVAAMVRRVRTGLRDPAPWTWLTRGGAAEIQDIDAEWLASAAQAYDEADLGLVFVVVGRHGWFDPRSGLRREWVRLRPTR